MNNNFERIDELKRTGTLPWDELRTLLQTLGKAYPGENPQQAGQPPRPSYCSSETAEAIPGNYAQGAERFYLSESGRSDAVKIMRAMHVTSDEAYLYAGARKAREFYYGREVYLRGLIEFTNYCRNDCRYCGIRRSNRNLERYRLTGDEIIQCCEQGYLLGFRTFVLQGGEDLHYSASEICEIVRRIRTEFPDCAVTLSIGEKEREEYQQYFEAGAERYLLRQETSNPAHYRYLHPEELTIENRKRCLEDLREIGYQVGCGIMVGSPGQTWDNVIEDLFYMKEFRPQMVGIGPFIPHKDTPFRDEKPGTLVDTLHLLGVIRLMIPDVLLPATTALGTIHPLGRELGMLAGANVVMPNLSPQGVRDKYMLYDGKICTGDEAAECRRCMEGRIGRTGYRVVTSRGDCAGF